MAALALIPSASWTPLLGPSPVADSRRRVRGDRRWVWQIGRAVTTDLETDMAAVAAGDQVAFGRLYDELSPAVFGVVRRVLRDPAQAEEVTQEVFVEIWRQAARFDATRANPRTWAVMIAHRRAVDRVRSEQAHRDRHDKVAAEDAAPERPDDLAIERADQDRARAALDTLPSVQREAIELAFYEGLTHVEIAERLGVALGTVKTRIRDGLLRLRGAMGGAA
jgi:RNA polymerase sigma-70 factor (ECF subfamily)